MQSTCLLILLSLFFFLQTTSGCGATNHNVIARLAFLWSNDTEMTKIIGGRMPIFQNGASFPDWGYPLDGMHNAAEAAHWPPFTRAVVQYIQKNYPGTPEVPFPPPAQDLIALLFGIVSHSVADIIWHNLGPVSTTQQGWIQSLAYIDFHGSYDDSHSLSDTGGEFILANSYDLTFLENEWYFPIEDIYNIYQLLNYTEVTLETLLEGNTLLFAETEAIRHLADDAFFIYGQQSPFLQEQLMEFFEGGILDMAVWTDRCWGDLSRWLHKGPTTPLCPIVEPLEFSRNPDFFVEHPRKNWLRRFQETEFWKFFGKIFTENVEVTFIEETGTAIFRNREPVETVYERRKSELINSGIKIPFFSENKIPSGKKNSATECLPMNGAGVYNSSFTITPDGSQFFFGDSVSVGDFNLNGKMDIAIGAPGYWTPGYPQTGAVFILLDAQSSEHTVLNFDPYKTNPNIIKLIGGATGDRFGSALAVVDINKDGADDLVVSAPRAYSEYMDYRGEVSIYFGNPITKTLSTTPNVTIYVPGTISPAGPASGAYTGAGGVLTSLDIDVDGYKDLVIGAPLACDVNKLCEKGDSFQRGLVAVFLSSRWALRTEKNKIPLDKSDWLRYGENAFDWFGHHVDMIQLLPVGPGSVLVVGAPTHAQGNNEEVGILYAFLTEDVVSGRTDVKPYWIINGTSQWDRLGSHTSVGNPYGGSYPYLMLSIPSRDTYPDIGANVTYWQAGAALLIPYNIIQSRQTVDDLIPKGVLFMGDDLFGRLGWSSGWSDVNGDGMEDLWISEPFLNNGRIYHWYGGKTFPPPGTSINDCMASANFCIDYPDTQLQSLFGSNIVSYKENSQNNVILTAPRDSQFGPEMAGSVVILFDQRTEEK